MATVAKFYLLDAVSPNAGTMPSNSPATLAGGKLGAGTEATGNTTARDATDVPGTSNPDLKAVVTSEAAATHQRLGYRRYVSRPLAATTVAAADGAWAWNFATFESNTNHTTSIGDGPHLVIYLWRPGTGARIGTTFITSQINQAMTTTEANAPGSGVQTWTGTQAILDGDILVFDVYSDFTQGMATAYTESFCYNGTTEGSATTCATLVTPPSAMTLSLNPPVATHPPPHLPFV